MRIALALACAAVAFACVTPDGLMALSAKRGTPDEPAAATKLSEVAADAGRGVGLRSWALRAMSRLQKVPNPCIDRVGKVLVRSNEDPIVRGWAAFAMGEWRRKETLTWMAQALSGPMDPGTGYFVLEGMAKVLPAITGDIELNEKVVRAMTAFRAHQQEFTPSMYDLVHEFVANLRVLVIVLNKTLAEKAGAGEAGHEEIYAAVFGLLVSIENAKDKYVNGFANNEQSLREAFDASVAAVKVEYRPLYFLVAWYGGYLGDNRELSSLCADRLAAWVADADPRLRLVLAWTLSRMEVYEKGAHDALVTRLLPAETDGAVLRLLGSISTEPGRPDKLQELLRIRAVPVQGAGPARDAEVPAR